MYLDGSTIHKLRSELHRRIDEIFDSITQKTEESAEIQLALGQETGPWSYTWPDASEEIYVKTRWYELTSPEGSHRVRVAWTAGRPAWGKIRRRAVVFQQVGASSSDTYYPWSEFAETDDGLYAAAIPDPRRPRALLSDGDSIPARFSELVVLRTDEVFHSVKRGPSLRLVVNEDDEEAMVKHGLWVAGLRHRI